MIVVISDLHLEEEASDNLAGIPPFTRNLPAKAYISFIARLADEAKRNGAQRLDLVLAGDIFDIHRTGLWFSDENPGPKPYVSSDEVDDKLESKVMEILDAISKEARVQETLQSLRDLSEGNYYDPSESAEKEFPVKVRLHYIPGNHDRLANSTPAVRSKVRGLLALQGSDRFPYWLTFEDPPLLIRHGHEYDPFNFRSDLSGKNMTIPTSIDDVEYQGPALGDYVTVEFASRLPVVFRSEHGEQEIATDEVLRAVYRRLLEFDDVRPQSALLDFLQSTPRPEGGAEDEEWTREVWRSLDPVFRILLEEMPNQEFLKSQLRRLDKPWRVGLVDVLQAFLAFKPWSVGIRLSSLLKLVRFLGGGGSAAMETGGPRWFAVREEGIENGSFQFVIAGHTHHPEVALLAADRHGERYYIDTGTWRNQVPSTPGGKGFGRLKALTYAVVYGRSEDLGDLAEESGTKLWSIDYWSGVKQRWPIS